MDDRVGGELRATADTGIRRTGRWGSDGGVEVDLRLLARHMGRKVHFALRNMPRSLGSPHQHSGGHSLVVSRGTAWLAVRPAGEAIRVHRLGPGVEYVVPAYTPHQLLLEAGAIVAAYVPTTTWFDRSQEVTPLAEDWFMWAGS